MVRSKQNEEFQNNNGGLHNVLSGGTTVIGSISSESDFRIDGKIEGDVTCKGKIVIGPKGSVKGNLISDNAEIFGQIEGAIRIKEKLVLKATAHVKGDLYIQSLEIEPGSQFNGTCSMSGNVAMEAPPNNEKMPPPAKSKAAV